MTKAPQFLTIAGHPVRILYSDDGTPTVERFDRATETFVNDLVFYGRMIDPDEDVESMTKAEFDALVESLRTRK
jgi:hypothetical protein